MKRNEPRWGDIWLVEDYNEWSGTWGVTPHIQAGTRPCIIVSNNAANKHSPALEVVFTTTREKPPLPTHFRICFGPRPSTVLCEAVATVPRKNLKHRIGHLSPKDEGALKRCLKISLGLE